MKLHFESVLLVVSNNRLSTDTFVLPALSVTIFIFIPSRVTLLTSTFFSNSFNIDIFASTLRANKSVSLLRSSTYKPSTENPLNIPISTLSTEIFVPIFPDRLSTTCLTIKFCIGGRLMSKGSIIASVTSNITNIPSALLTVLYIQIILTKRRRIYICKGIVFSHITRKTRVFFMSPSPILYRNIYSALESHFSLSLVNISGEHLYYSFKFEHYQYRR